MTLGAKHSGAPDFTVSGDPSAIRAKTAEMRTLSGQYRTIADSLSSLSTDGWTGRAADRFREKFSVEPGRWQQAANGFSSAAEGLDAYATALEDAQRTAAQCKTDYEEGNRVSEQARKDYDADVERGKREKREWEAKNGPGTFDLTIEPFSDPGEPIRQQAVSTFNEAIAGLEAAAQTCADLLRGSCEGAPNKRNWIETGLDFLGGIIYGALESLGDVALLVAKLNPIFMPIEFVYPLLSGELTFEEFAAKKQIDGETALAFFKALKEDPFGVGIEIGKSVLDWDTWADDPARAIGHLIPDVVMTLATAGTGTAATKSSSILAKLGTHADDLADVGRAARGVDGAADEVKRLDKLNLEGVGEAPKDFRKAEREGLTREEWKKLVDDWVRRFAEANPGLSADSIRAIHYYTTNQGYNEMNGALRDGRMDEVQKLVDDAKEGINRLPSYSQPVDLYRGTTLPRELIDAMLRDKTFSDPAFLSASRKTSVADMMQKRAMKGNAAGEVPVYFTIKGSTVPTIESLSAYETQAEHVFLPGTDFKILDMVQDEFYGRKGWRVIMVEERKG